MLFSSWRITFNVIVLKEGEYIIRKWLEPVYHLGSSWNVEIFTRILIIFLAWGVFTELNPINSFVLAQQKLTGIQPFLCKDAHQLVTPQIKTWNLRNLSLSWNITFIIRDVCHLSRTLIAFIIHLDYLTSLIYDFGMEQEVK